MESDRGKAGKQTICCVLTDRLEEATRDGVECVGWKTDTEPLEVDAGEVSDLGLLSIRGHMIVFNGRADSPNVFEEE